MKDQVKADLLMDAMSQVTDEQKLAAISEPDFDVTAVEVPDAPGAPALCGAPGTGSADTVVSAGAATDDPGSAPG